MRTEISVPTLTVRRIDAGVRPVRLRLPFRFGSVTLSACPQLFVRAEVEIAGQGRATGHAAEMVVPKWFDKRAGFSHQDNLAHQLDSLQRASDAYLNDRPASAFGLFERHYAALMRAGADAGATELSSAYGQAVLDRALLDALCRASNQSFFDAVGANAVGLADSALLPDLKGFDWNGWLRGLTPLRAVAARHTVGMLDSLDDAPDAADGLPVSLPAVIRRYGHRHFKIKLGGQVATDIERLRAVLAVLDREAPGHVYSLDGNEQYADAAALRELFDALRRLPELRSDALLYIEQPIARERSLDAEMPWREAPAPLLMDEADGTLDAFARGRALGWAGVSSKACKGLYKSIANRARCDRFNQSGSDGARCFMSAEDLTCQAGLSVQQDLALLALLGLDHTERNGHHYAGGFGNAPAAEQQQFAAAHADLYAGTPPRLHIAGGLLKLDSLFASGYAHAADPDWSQMQPLRDAPAML